MKEEKKGEKKKKILYWEKQVYAPFPRVALQSFKSHSLKETLECWKFAATR